MLPVQSYPYRVMRSEVTRPALRRYESSLTKFSLRKLEMVSSGVCGKLPMLLLHSSGPLRRESLCTSYTWPSLQ